MEQASRRRRADGGYARGEETRLRIIDAAIRLFGQCAYDGVSTREIAAEADVNPASLQYYFDNKDGLYRACAEHIAEHVGQFLGPILSRMERLLTEGAPDPALIEAYCHLIETMAELMFAEGRNQDWLAYLATEQAGFGQGIAFPLLRARFVDRMEAICAALIGRLTGEAPESDAARLRSLAIGGQIKIFHLGRRAALQCLGWETMSPEHGRLATALVVEQTRILLTQLAERREKR